MSEIVGFIKCLVSKEQDYSTSNIKGKKFDNNPSIQLGDTLLDQTLEMSRKEVKQEYHYQYQLWTDAGSVL